MASSRRRWQAYTERMGADLSDLFNRNIRETVKAGVRALVANTQHDSSRAAYHWVVIPNKGSVNPGSWKQMTFDPMYHRPPVGGPGDKGKNKQMVIREVVQRESSRAIDKTVKGRKGQASVFTFQNNVPGQLNDLKGTRELPASGENYRKQAKLKEA